jgi:glycosyltransferase involved in cell wall biosynthesis
VSSVLRVAHVITRMNVGGAAGFVRDVCAMLPRDRFEQVVITGPAPECEGSFLDRLSVTGARVHLLESLARAPRPLDDLRAYGALKHLLAELSPRVVHTHTAKAGVLGRRAAATLGIPCVHHIHGWASLEEGGAVKRRLFLSAERLAARWCQKLLAVTTKDIERGLALGIGREEQYALIRAGIDVDAVRRAAGHPPRELVEHARSGPLVGFIGRLCEQKDPLTFLRAARLVAREVADARFVLVGDGPLHAEVDRLERECGLGDRLLRMPFRDDVPALLGGLAVLAHPSRHEGLPRLLLEAFAVGTPVVATGVGGCAELLEDGVNALVVPPGDAEALARALTRLLREPGVTQPLTTSASVTARDYGIREPVEALGRLYELVAR